MGEVDRLPAHGLLRADVARHLVELFRTTDPDRAVGLAYQIESSVAPVNGGYGAPFLGQYRGIDGGWGHHEVVVKDGRGFDATTGKLGEAIDQYRSDFEYGGDLIFSPAPR